MAIPPQHAAERWGCAICGAYPESRQVFFHADAAARAETEAARQAWRARTAQPGWVGPQRTTLPHGVWLCGPHAAAAAPLLGQERAAGLAALRARLSG